MKTSGNHTQDIINAYVDGVMTERERIITLLSGYVCHLDSCTHNGCNKLRFAIELVKGEQK